MLVESTYNEYRQTFDQTVSGRYLKITVEENGLMLVDILFDDGTGLRPLNPMTIAIGGNPSELPQTLTPGRYVIELISLASEVRGITLIGLGMNRITGCTLSDDPSLLGSGEVFNESPVGPVNGSNQVFSTERNFVTGSTRVYLNTTRMVLGVDYSESGNDTITFTQAPIAGDTIRIDYSQL